MAQTYGNALHAHRDITTGDRAVLMEIAQMGDRTVVQMAARRGISKQAIQKTVDRLELRLLVEKIIPRQDRRNRIVRLTGLGQSILQDMLSDEIIALEGVLPLLAPEDVVAVNRLLDVIEPAMSTQSVMKSKTSS